jgi:hypothetical protein
MTQPAVLVLGTYHMANPGLDYVNLEVDDVLSDRRQAEIRAVVERLLRFGPTKVAVEDRPERERELNQRYSRYRAGDLDLSRDETEQIGFRMAGSAGHERLYPVDWMGPFPMEPVLEFAASHGQSEIAEAMFAEAQEMAERFAEMQKTASVRELLLAVNQAGRLHHDHALYLSLARIGAGLEYPGVELLDAWYGRNLRIFANILRIAERGERTLVVIGQGHAPLPHQLLEDSEVFEVEEVASYLS